MKTRIAVFAVILSFFMATGLAQETVKSLEGKLGQNPNDVPTLIQLGRLYHDQGATGDKDAVEKGFTCFDKALQINASNAVALAYQGSLWTMRGRDAWWPFTKMSHVDKGIDEMDKAVDLAPDDITVRLVRGINSVQLPDMFHRLSIALKDFDYLVKRPELPHFDAQLQCRIYCWAGVANKHDHQNAKAKEMLQKAISLAPDSPLAARARDELKDIQ